jgi:hypothetical protein
LRKCVLADCSASEHGDAFFHFAKYPPLCSCPYKAVVRQGDIPQKVDALFEQSSEWRTAWENIKPGTVEGNGEAAAAEERAEKDAEDAVLAATGL